MALKKIMITTIAPKFEAVLTVLINHRSDQDISIEDISRLAPCGLSTAKRHIKELKKQGLIKVEKAGNSRTNKSRYSVSPQVFALIKTRTV